MSAERIRRGFLSTQQNELFARCVMWTVLERRAAYLQGEPKEQNRIRLNRLKKGSVENVTEYG